MKRYEGDRTIDGIVATVDGKELSDFSDTKRFDSGGFEWGYEGSAPTQLAFAILADHLGDTRRAAALAPQYMENVTANFGNAWEITSEDVDNWLETVAASAA